MKLGYITVMVRDLERSLTFYQELAQLQVMRRFRPGPGEIAFLANGAGETMLELVAIPDAEHVCTRGLVVSFAAKDCGKKRLSWGMSLRRSLIIRPSPGTLSCLIRMGLRWSSVRE